MTQGGAIVTDARQVSLACPNCERVHTYSSEDPPSYAPHCSLNCMAHDRGLRLCTCCTKLQQGESFQRPPGDPHSEPVCEECAATCMVCSVMEGARLEDGSLVADPDLLNDNGECRLCEAVKLAKSAWVAAPRSTTARRLYELLEDLSAAPKGAF